MGRRQWHPHCSTQCSYFILSSYFIFLILSSLKSSQANLIHRVGFHMGGAYLPTCQSENFCDRAEITVCLPSFEFPHSWKSTRTCPSLRKPPLLILRLCVSPVKLQCTKWHSSDWEELMILQKKRTAHSHLIVKIKLPYVLFESFGPFSLFSLKWKYWAG